MEEGKLIQVRCPGMVWDKNKKEMVKCGKLCVKVFPGSSGEIVCRSCHLKFRFYVDSQAKSMLSVKAKPIDSNSNVG